VYCTALKSARNAANKRQILDKWIRQWNEGTETAVKLRAMSKRPHFTSGGKLYTQITVKQYVAWLVRLRTAHCSLNKYLHQRGHEEEPLCACREEEETVEHFLLKCKKYTTQRGEDGKGGWSRRNASRETGGRFEMYQVHDGICEGNEPKTSILV
jgi:hypothetical protein